MTPAVAFADVDILFSTQGRRGDIARATAMLDAGEARAAILSATGVVLGVAGASLAVAPGEICVLMGLSGSGKSTLLRAANGLAPVTRGRVWIADGPGRVDVAACRAAALRRVRRERVAMVFQQFALLPWRTVRENVALGLELRGTPAAMRRRIVDEKLALVGLEQWADRATSELSGGMQQRVGLARAFATDADVMLMDEPFSALDPLIRAKLQDELLALQARVRKTILFVSHDLDEALKLGGRIAIMNGGRIVQQGTPEDIVLRPADDYVAAFVRHMNPLDALKGSAVMRTQAVPAHGPVLADSTSLREIIAARHATGQAVRLTRDGAVVGVVGDAEILAALAGRGGWGATPILDHAAPSPVG
jgi:glycine betaine/proline transport system ATP-binding protein